MPRSAPSLKTARWATYWCFSWYPLERCHFITGYFSHETSSWCRSLKRSQDISCTTSGIPDALYIRYRAGIAVTPATAADDGNTQKMTDFVTLFYGLHFLRATLAHQDTWELQNHKGIAQTAMISLEICTTYIEPSALVFSLFSNCVPSIQRQKVAERLSAIKISDSLSLRNSESGDQHAVQHMVGVVTERRFMAKRTRKKMASLQWVPGSASECCSPGRRQRWCWTWH